MSKHKRILFILAVSGLVCGAYLWFFGAATAFALEARYLGWTIPVLKKTPTELPDQSVAQGPGLKLTYFGYGFEAPWEIDEAKSKELEQYNPQPSNTRIIAFRSGNKLLVSRIAPKEFVNGFLSFEELARRPEREISLVRLAFWSAGALKGLYGEDALQSDYSLKERILETTPDKVGFLRPRKEAVGNALLVVVKGMMMPIGEESGIYRIRTGVFRGFQFGDPQSPRPLSLEVYNEEGGFSFIFAPRKNESPITQAEVNRVIQSLRKANK